MRKGLVQIIGLALFLLYIVGAMIVPTYHEAHCKDHAAADGDTDCPICQIGNTPAIFSLPLHIVDSDQRVVGIVQLTGPKFVAAELHSFAQARAPPAG